MKSETVEFNINSWVSVKLTYKGKELHRLRWEKIMQHFPRGQEPYPYTPPKEDERGWSEWQMWDLMQQFGPHISMGFDPPFETTIQIEKTWK